MIVEIQVLPSPSGTDDEPYAHVHAGIEVITGSGVTYEVGPLGTSLEGEPEVVWPLVRRVHEACLADGADRVITVLKLAEGAGPGGPTMGSLVDRYR